MAAKSADLFGTFLDTVSSSSGVKRGQETPSPTRGPSAPEATPRASQNASVVADAIVKELQSRGEPTLVTELLPQAHGTLSLLLEAIGQLQSYGLVVNHAGMISLSGTGADMASNA